MGGKKYKGRRVAAFIFDLDGTLIDSGLDIAIAGNFARGHFGLPALPVETLVSYVGDGLALFLARALGHEGNEMDAEMLTQATTVFRDHYGRHCLDNTVAYPGVLPTLARYRQFPLMVATNKPRHFTEKILDGLHLTDAFRKVVTADDVIHKKPDPEALVACLAGLEIEPTEVAVVGDHPNDIESAHALGATAVVVTYGMTPPGQLRGAGPDLVIDKFADLADLFPSRG